MQSSFFAYLFRMKYVQRWGLMRSSISENIQEHSFQVAMVAHMLGVIRNKRFNGSVDLGRLVLYALYHDCAEVVTTDLPTPIKNLTPELQNSFKEIEELVAMRFYSMLPEDLRDDYEWIFMSREEDKELHKLCKAADVICAYYKCVEESKLGNSDFQIAQKTLRNSLELHNIPEIDVFLAEFGEDLSFPLEKIL